MDLDETIQSRRSIRMFTERLVETGIIYQIIDAGRWAPTATNKQEAKFIYIDDGEIIKKLCDLGTAHFVKDCRQMILVLYDNRIDNTEYHDDILSAAAVIQNMLLKATQLGVGTCWVANLPSKAALRRLFCIPSYYDPISLVVIGYALREPAEVKRKYDLDNMISNNIFDRSKDVSGKKPKLKLFARRMSRRLYIRLPKTASLRKLAGKYEKKFDN